MATGLGPAEVFRRGVSWLPLVAFFCAPACSSSSATTESGNEADPGSGADRASEGGAESNDEVLESGGRSISDGSGDDDGSAAAGDGSGSGGRDGVGGSTGSEGSLLCPGWDPPPSGYETCRQQNDCLPGYLCAPRVPVSSCGGVAPPPLCASSDDCGPGLVCDPVRSPNPACDYQRACYAPCDAASCGQGQSCGADGRCVWDPCDAGYDCPDGAICDATRPTADVHGCAPRTCDGDGYQCPAKTACFDTFSDGASRVRDPHGCAMLLCSEGADCAENFRCDVLAPVPGCVLLTCDTDSDCDCGACIQGMCQPRLFVCTPPPPP